MHCNGQLWYGFYGAVLEDESKFDSRVGELCRELGSRVGPTAVTAVPTPTLAPKPAPAPTPAPASVVEADVRHPSAAVALVNPATPAQLHQTEGGTSSMSGFTPSMVQEGGHEQEEHERYSAPQQALDRHHLVNGSHWSAPHLAPPNSSPQLSEYSFLLNVQIERERESSERAERADRAATAERQAERIAQRELVAERDRAADRERAAERELRLVMVTAMVVCASAVACVVILRSK